MQGGEPEGIPNGPRKVVWADVAKEIVRFAGESREGLRRMIILLVSVSLIRWVFWCFSLLLLWWLYRH